MQRGRACLRQPQHEAQGHAGPLRDEARDRGGLPSVQVPELREDVQRGDTVQASRDEDDGSGHLMDKRVPALRHADQHRPEDHGRALGHDKAHTEGCHGRCGRDPASGTAG